MEQRWFIMGIDQVFCNRVVQRLLDDFSSDELVRCPDGEERTAGEIVFWLYIRVCRGHAEDMPYLLDIAKRAGIAEVLLRIGEMYLCGICVEHNLDEAYRCFLQASYAGSAEAMVYVGLMHWRGVGIFINYSLALDWVSLAAEEQFEPACILIAKMKAALNRRQKNQRNCC